MTKKLLLHVCCAPCATYPLSVLLRDYEVTAYFYDPNIHPRSEYDLRLAEARKYFKNRVKLIETEYDDTRWFELTQGLEREPERGKRCHVCYKMRLAHTAEYAAHNGFEIFTAVLTVSPHKDARAINVIGAELEAEFGVKYLPTDWKKCNGYQQSITMSKAANLHRQDYCGCIHSKRVRDEKYKGNSPVH